MISLNYFTRACLTSADSGIRVIDDAGSDKQIQKEKEASDRNKRRKLEGDRAHQMLPTNGMQPFIPPLPWG